MKYTKNLVLFNLIVINLIDQPTPPIVIEQGILTGIINSDGTIFEYIGIPYGVFNSSNRFQAPYPAPNWEGTFKATEESFCPHFFIFKTWGTEDCLKVNVYVPARAVKPVPVMFYIHGGGFTIGSGGKLLYGPEFLVRHDVILVTLNYRLDLIGFLCLGIKEAPGNTALRDQIAALRWVKKNIAAFGGDPDNITLFGQSAGGVAASALYASKSTNGLFNKIIVQSGSSSANWAMNVNPLWTARFMAKQLGHDGVEDPHELLEIFSKMSYKELLSVQPKRPISKNFDTELLQLPCIERRIPGVEPIIDDLPYNLMKNHPKNIPIMYSTSNREGLFLMAFENNEKLKTKENCNLFASDLTFPNEDIAVEVAKSIREFYFGSENYTVALKDSIIKYCTQLYFEIPAQLETELILDNNKAPVYNLIFEYSGGRNFMKYGLGYYDTEGACHGDETLYLFNGRLWVLPVSKEDQVIIDYMTQFWTNFAKYSNPTPPWQNTSIKWDPSEKGNLKFLYVNNHLKMGPLPNPEGYNLWKNIYQKYRRRDAEFYFS